MQKDTQQIQQNKFQISHQDQFTQYNQISDQDFKLYSKNNLDIPYNQQINNIIIHVGEPSQKGSGIQRFTVYKLHGEDSHGKWETFRRYSQFDALRSTLVQRWPSIFIPPIPSKKILNKTQNQLTQNRIRFLNYFVKKIAQIQFLYESQQFQIFIRHPQGDIGKSLQKFKRQSYTELLSKYQKTFQQFVQVSNNQQSKNQIQKFQAFVKQSKANLLQFRKQARSLAESRQKYNQKLFFTFQKLLPEYQSLSMTEFSNKKDTKFLFKKVQDYEQLNSKNLKEILNSNPFWLIYDLIKFEERQLQAYLQAHRGLIWISNKLEDSIHDIKINTQEIQNLANGKTTLRSILTKGNNEQIQVKLTGRNEQLQKQKEILTQLLNIAYKYLQKFIRTFKLQRQRFFNKVISHTFSYEMSACKSNIDYFGSLQRISVKLIDI